VWQVNEAARQRWAERAASESQAISPKDPSNDISAGGTDFTQKVQVLAGLLVAGFAGALNFIGLRSEEVSTVLRNEPHYPTFVLSLLVAGILAAIASIFVSPRWHVAKWVWKATACLLIVVVAVTVIFIPIPNFTSTVERWLAVGFVGLAGLLAICFLPGVAAHLKVPGHKPFAPFRDARRKSAVLAQGLLVFVAIALSATASYAALRLETRSQLASTAAQLSAIVTETSGTASLQVSIDASKLASADRVNVSVTGLERDKSIAEFCRNIKSMGTLTCLLAPCYVTRFTQYTYGRARPSGCDSLSSGVYQPNADGSVQQTLTIPFSDSLYQRLELIGQVCIAGSPGTPCSYQGSNITRVDIEIPKDSSP
jgi:hypothetical protein